MWRQRGLIIHDQALISKDCLCNKRKIHPLCVRHIISLWATTILDAACLMLTTTFLGAGYKPIPASHPGHKRKTLVEGWPWNHDGWWPLSLLGLPGGASGQFNDPRMYQAWWDRVHFGNLWARYAQVIFFCCADGCYNEEKEEAQQQFGLCKISSSVCRVFRRRGDNSWLDPCLAMHAISCHIVQLKVIASSQLSLAKHSCISFFTNSNEIKSHLEWKA